jgi:uncharacterized protein YcfL
MKHHLLLIVLVAMAVACSSTPEPQVAATDEQHCTNEARLGTNIKSTRCVTRMQRDEEKRGTQEIADAIRRASARPSPTTAGSN